MIKLQLNFFKNIIQFNSFVLLTNLNKNKFIKFIITILFVYLITNYLTFFYIFLGYAIFILYFYYYIFSIKNKSQLIINKNKSIIKDKEFILFKFNLFKFYYSTLIILFVCLFKQNFFFLLLEFNTYFIIFLLIILIIYSILLSNFFNLILFKLHLEIKIFIETLNEINVTSSLTLAKNEVLNYYYSKNKNKFYTQSRNFSTYNKNVNEIEDQNLNFDVELDYVTESNKKELSLIKNQAIKEFKKVYGNGYLGYKHIHSFSSVANLINSDDSISIEANIKSLEPKFRDYLNEIPENITYSILPVLRWQNIDGDYKSSTISESIKITRLFDCNLLAEWVVYSLQDAFLKYEIKGLEIELFMMGRPWLRDEDFMIREPEITQLLSEQIEKEIYGESKLSLSNNKKNFYSEKALKLKNFEYKFIAMNNYGAPILNKDNNLIGYNLNNNKCASIKTFYNENNLLCNKVSIREFDERNLTFKNIAGAETLNSWVDIKTEFGFIREYKKKILLW